MPLPKNAELVDNNNNNLIIIRFFARKAILNAENVIKHVLS